MTNTYLRKKMIYIYDESVRILLKIKEFHKKNELYEKEDADPRFFNYFLSTITALDIIDDKISTLLKKIYAYNKKSKLPIKETQISKLEYIQKKVKSAKELEKKFL